LVRPQEYDVVRLRISLPHHGLPKGSEGTVLIDHGKYTQHSIAPAAYEIEFSASEGRSEAIVTVDERDLEVIFRPTE
jgi:hypothetical protein